VVEDELERAQVSTKATRTALTTVLRALAIRRSEDEVARVSIRSSNVHMKAVGKAIREQNTSTDTS
jgi:transposase-like protein